MFYRRKILLALIEAFGRVLTKTDCQKLLFLYCRRKGKNYYDFFPYTSGSFSLILAQDKNRLTDLGFLTTDGDFQLKGDQSFLNQLDVKDLPILCNFVSEIVDFIIEEDERDWKQKWQDHRLQYDLFDLDENGEGKKRDTIAKVPYKYFYKFLSVGDTTPRRLMIEDWEIGMLYWNCLRQSGGDEKQANQLVRRKYFDDFCLKKDIHLFLGTTF